MVIRFLIYCSILLFTSSVFGDKETVQDGCFNFSRPVRESLHKPIPFSKTERKFESGVRQPGAIPWAAGRGVVRLPVERVYEWLLDHKNWKDMSKTTLDVKKLDRAGFLELHVVDVSIRLFAFISVDWQEEWAYTLLKGTRQAPEEILVSYQKSAGTSHLENLCGSILLKKHGPRTTDLQFYEQTKATRVDKDVILKMHRDNFEILDRLASGAASEPQ